MWAHGSKTRFFGDKEKKAQKKAQRKAQKQAKQKKLKKKKKPVEFLDELINDNEELGEENEQQPGNPMKKVAQQIQAETRNKKLPETLAELDEMLDEEESDFSEDELGEEEELGTTDEELSEEDIGEEF